MGNLVGQRQEGYAGNTIMWFPSCIGTRICWCIREAERLKGSPPTTAEFMAVFRVNYTTRIPKMYLYVFPMNFYRKDLFFADKDFIVWSMDGPDGSEERKTLEKFTPRIQRLYPDCVLDYTQHLRAKRGSPTLNLKEHMELFKSKDEALWQKNKWIYDVIGGVFLDGERQVGNKITFASFPRSGNTFLRKYLTLLTGVPTGSDNTLHTDTSMQCSSFKGEDLIDDTCWVTKTHSPWWMIGSPRFSANKVLVIVRNPTESNLSWLHLCSTGAHSAKVPCDVTQEYPNFWKWWTNDQMTLMLQWYKQYLDDAERKTCPILFVRFEDMVADPEPQLEKIMKFMLNTNDLEGTNAERRIKEVISMGAKATETYQLKDTTRKFNNNAKLYSEDQMAWIKDSFKEWLHYFGYAKVPQDPDNPTGFYEYDGQDEHLMKMYKGYERQTEDVLEWNSRLTDAERDVMHFEFNDPAKNVPLEDQEKHQQISTMIMNFYEKKFYGRAIDQCD